MFSATRKCIGSGNGDADGSIFKVPFDPASGCLDQILRSHISFSLQNPSSFSKNFRHLFKLIERLEVMDRTRDPQFRDDDESHASEPLMEDIVLHERTEKTWKDSRQVPLMLVLYVFGAHVLGWMLGLYLSPVFPELAEPASPALSGGDEVNRFAPPVRTKLVKFEFKTDDWVPGPNDASVTDAIFDNWTSMLPNGNGMVKIPNWEDYPYLTQPTQLVNNETAFNTAWVHQLHCVYWVMREYHRVLHHGPDGSEYFIDPTHNSYHTSHCFNYIRQAILCGLDTALEGSGEGVGVADGSGQMHMCRDDTQSIEWLEAHRYMDFRAIA